MREATFKCPICGEEKKFKLPGKDAYCEKCDKKMIRIFKNISNTSVIDDQILEVGQKMLYS